MDSQEIQENSSEMVEGMDQSVEPSVEAAPSPALSADQQSQLLFLRGIATGSMLAEQRRILGGVDARRIPVEQRQALASMLSELQADLERLTDARVAMMPTERVGMMSLLDQIRQMRERAINPPAPTVRPKPLSASQRFKAYIAGRTTRLARRVGDVVGTVRALPEATLASVRGSVGRLRDGIRARVQPVRDRVAGLNSAVHARWRGAVDRVGEVRDTVMQRASDFRDGVSERVGDIQDGISERVEGLRTGMRDGFVAASGQVHDGIQRGRASARLARMSASRTARGVRGGFASVAERLAQWRTDLSERVRARRDAATSAVKDFAVGTAQRVGDGARSIRGGATRAVDVISAGGNAALDRVGEVRDAANERIDAAINASFDTAAAIRQRFTNGREQAVVRTAMRMQDVRDRVAQSVNLEAVRRRAQDASATHRERDAFAAYQHVNKLMVRARTLGATEQADEASAHELEAVLAELRTIANEAEARAEAAREALALKRRNRVNRYLDQLVPTSEEELEHQLVESEAEAERVSRGLEVAQASRRPAQTGRPRSL